MKSLEVIKNIIGNFSKSRCKTSDDEATCRNYIGKTIIEIPEDPFDIYGKCEMVALEISDGYVRYKFRYQDKLDKWFYGSMKCSTYAYGIKECDK